MLNNQQFTNFINSYSSFLIVTHERPDADAVGSLVAMFYYLESINKDVKVQLGDDIPPKLKFLLEGDLITERTVKGLTTDCDAVIVLDCSNHQRTVFADNSKLWTFPVMNIDHHNGNSNFGIVNVVDRQAAATGQMLYRLFKQENFKISDIIAQAIFSAIVGDTGGFKFSNTSAEIHLIAADLYSYAIEPHVIMGTVLDLVSAKAFDIVRDALNTVRIIGRVATIEVSNKLLLKYNLSKVELPDLVNYIRNIENVPVSILFTETEPDSVSISFRSEPPIDISVVARQFGGGGHKQASGCSVEGKLTEVVSEVISFTRQYLEK